MLLNATEQTGASIPLALTWNPEPRSVEQRSHPEAAMLQAFCRALQLDPVRLPPTKAGIIEYFQRNPVKHPPSTMLQMEIALQDGARQRGIDTIFSGHGGDQCVSYPGGLLVSDLLVSGRWAELARQARESRRSAAALSFRAVGQFMRRLGFHASEASPIGKSLTRNPYRLGKLARWGSHRRGGMGVHATVRGRSWEKLRSGYTDMRMDAWYESGSRRALRYAYPLLDREVLEFALGLPPELFARGQEQRWLMRQLAQRYIPEEVSINRNKEEPSRSLAMVEALEDARPAMIAALERSCGNGKCSNLIDTHRLLADLRNNVIAPRGERSPQFRSKRVALEFLDLDWDG